MEFTGETFQGGFFFRDISPLLRLYSDASLLGWGVSLGLPYVSGYYPTEEANLHINLLELIAIVLTLCHWVCQVQGKALSIEADSSSTLAYLQKKGRTNSKGPYLRLGKFFFGLSFLI